MAYVPVAQRKEEPAAGYTPVATRIALPSVFSGVANSTAPALAPTAPLPNFQMLSGKNVVAPMPDPKVLAYNLKDKKPDFLSDTTLSQGQESATHKITKVLPQALQAPAETIIKDISEGLFGDQRQKEIVREYERQGVTPNLTTLFTSEGLLPFLGRSNTDKIESRAKAHEDAGVAPERAASLAFYEVFGGQQGIPGTSADRLSLQARDRLAALQPTPEEKSTAFWADLGQKAGSVGDVLNVIPIGSISKSATLIRALKEVPHTAEGIAEAERLLVNSGIDEVIAKNAAEKFAMLTTDHDIEAGLKALEKLHAPAEPVIHEQKYTPVAQRGEPVDVPPLTRAAAELGKPAEVEPKVVSDIFRKNDRAKDVANAVSDEILKDAKKVDFADVTNKIPAELEPLAAEARKYKSAEEFIKNTAGSYEPPGFFKKAEVERRSPGISGLSHIDDIDTDKLLEQGVYKNMRKDLVDAMKSELNDRSKDTIKIYRATDTGRLLPGDYVALNKEYAETYLKRGNGRKIIEQEIPRSDLYFSSKSGDMVYAPNKIANLTDFYNKVRDVSETAAYAKRNEGRLPRLPKIPTKDTLSLKASAVRDLLEGKLPEAKQAVEEAKVERDIGREVLSNDQAKSLTKFESRNTGELPEVTGTKTDRTGRKVATSKFGKEGDSIVQELGFESPEAAQEALNEYKSLRKRVKSAEDNVRDKVKAYRDRKAVFDEVVRYVNAQGRERRGKIDAVKDFFDLDEKDMVKLMKNERDVRIMSDAEFADFVKRIEGKAAGMYLRNQAINELQYTIFEKELLKTENLYKALSLPSLENMSIDQIRNLNEFMHDFSQGDEFLGVRQLQTLKNTDLKGIYTRREATEKLLAQINKQREAAGKAPATLEDLNTIKVGKLDQGRGDATLARQNPLYELMVQEKNEAFLGAEMKVLDAKDRVDELFKKARASRSRGFTDRLIPTDTQIFHWLESTDAEKIKLAEKMTAEELEAAMYIRSMYSEMRDYLVKEGMMKRYRANYITHVRRGFLEAWKEEGSYVKGVVSGEKKGLVRRFGGGLLAAFKEVLQKYHQDEAVFNILDKDTKNVLPLEKFFQFSMQRSGELVPSKNVAKAFLQYLSTFEKKRALDSIIPKLDVYVHSLTPKKLTERGLEFDASLKKFFKEWMNTKKGRPTSLPLLTPGGPLDWALRTGVALTRLIDLGASLPVGIASNLGAQAAIYRGLGEVKYARGVSRLLTSNGRKILQKYRAFTGEPVFAKARSADATLGDTIMNGVFGLFSFADRKARQIYLLGSMSPEEYAKGELSISKLARMQTDLGRHLPMEGFESVVGKTAIGKLGTQYKSWALPLLSSTFDDLSKLVSAVKSGDSSFIKSLEFAELLRTTMVSAVVGLGAYGVLSDKRPQKDRTFAEKVANKAASDALSLVGALDPTLWTKFRLVGFLDDLATSLKQILFVERNKDGELSGVKKFQTTVTPGVVRQAISTEKAATGKKESSGLPSLPKLPKLPALPKLPKF